MQTLPGAWITAAPRGRGMARRAARHGPRSPAVAVDGLVERAPVGPGHRSRRPVGRVAGTEQERSPGTPGISRARPVTGGRCGGAAPGTAVMGGGAAGD